MNLMRGGKDQKEDNRDLDEIVFGARRKGIIMGIVGGVAGVAGGVYLGNHLNETYEVLKQAPVIYQQGLEAVTAIGGGAVGAAVLGVGTFFYDLIRNA